jgi:hypothetical protein
LHVRANPDAGAGVVFGEYKFPCVGLHPQIPVANRSRKIKRSQQVEADYAIETTTDIAIIPKKDDRPLRSCSGERNEVCPDQPAQTPFAADAARAERRVRPVVIPQIKRLRGIAAEGQTARCPGVEQETERTPIHLRLDIQLG